MKCVFPAKSEGRTCEYNGRIYQNGESFRAGCKHQCSCIDGAVGCAPLCSNKLPPASPSCPYPRLVRIPGQCCFSVDCHKGTWRLPHKHQVGFCLFLFSFNDKDSIRDNLAQQFGICSAKPKWWRYNPLSSAVVFLQCKKQRRLSWIIYTE